MSARRHSRTSTRLLAVVLATVVAVLGGASAYELAQRWREDDRALDRAVQQASERLGGDVEYPLWHLERAGVERVAREVLSSPDADGVVVRDEHGDVYVGLVKDATGALRPYGPEASRALMEGPGRSFSTTVWQRGQPIGAVTVHLSDARLRRERRAAAIGIALKLLLLSAALALVLFVAVQSVVVRPLARLEAWVKAAQAGPAPPGGAEEIASVARAFGEMSARVRAQTAAVEQERHKLQAIFDSVRVGMLLVGPDQRVGEANEVALAQAGRPREEVLGLEAARLLGCEHPRPGGEPGCAGCQLREAIGQVLERGEVVRSRELRARLERGPAARDAWIEVGAAPLELTGLRHALVTVAEITDRKKLEQQLMQSQKMETVGQLAGGVAHDFNNILTAILGCGHVIEGEPGLSDDGRECLAELLHAGERAAELTQSLLTFSRKQVLAPALLDLNAVVRGFQKMLQRLIGESVRVSCRLHPEPLRLLADRIMLEQLLMNLATNARDAMPDGGTLLVQTEQVELDDAHVRGEHLDAPGRYARLCVSDTGHGMDEATRLRVFEPFFTTKEVGRGTGLGLAIVYGIVQQHGGAIGVYSEVGHGTTFRIDLPLARGDAAGVAPEPLRSAELQGDETVLLVEDDAAVRAVVRRLLVAHGYTVVEAADGEEAVRLYGAHGGRIRAVLSDVIMPRMNGRRMYEELRRTDPHVRVLFMSGYSADLIGAQGMLAPGIELVGKPLDPRVLLERLRNVLDEAAAGVA